MLGIIVLTALTLTPLLMPIPELPGSLELSWVGIVPWVGVAALAAKGCSFRAALNPMSFAVGLLVIYAFLSISFATNPYEAFREAARWLCLGLWVIIGASIELDGRILRSWFRGVAAVGTLMALLVFAQFYFEVTWVPQGAPPGAVFFNKNMAGQFFLVVLPMIGLLWLEARSKLSIALTSIALVFVFVTITFLTSRAVYLSTILILIVALIFIVRNKKFRAKNPNWRLTLALMAVLFFLMIHFDADGFRADALAHYLGQGASVLDAKRGLGIGAEGVSFGNIRLTVWANTLAMIKENWIFGVGANNWFIEYPAYQNAVMNDYTSAKGIEFRRTHNEYLQMLAEFGLIGAFALLVLFASFGRWAWRVYRNPNLDAATLVLGLVIVGIGFDAIFSFPLHMPVVSTFFFLILGLIGRDLAPNSVLSMTRGKQAYSYKYLRSILATVFFGIAVVWSAWAVESYAARKLYNLARASIDSGQVEKALKYGMQSIEKNPLRVDYQAVIRAAYKAKWLAGDKSALLPWQNSIVEELEYYPYRRLALYGLAKNNLANERYDDARRVYQRLVDMNRNTAKAQASLGYAYFKTGDLDKAREHLQEAVRLSGEDPIALQYQQTLDQVPMSVSQN